MRVGKRSTFVSETRWTSTLKVFVWVGYETVAQGIGGSQFLLLRLSLFPFRQRNGRNEGLVLLGHGIVVVITGFRLSERAVGVQHQMTAFVTFSTLERVDNGVIDLVIGLVSFDILITVFQRGDGQDRQERENDQTRGDSREFRKELQDGNSCKSRSWSGLFPMPLTDARKVLPKKNTAGGRERT